MGFMGIFKNNKKTIIPQNLGSLLIKLSQSNFNLLSSDSDLVRRAWCPKFATDKWPFSDHFYLFFLQPKNWSSVILRCWTGLKLNWFKSYDTKHKYFCFSFFFLFWFGKKLFIFVMFFAFFSIFCLFAS